MEKNDKALQHIFQKTQNEAFLPDDFNRRLMQKVQKVQKRREIYTWTGIGLFSLFLVAGAFLIMKYYLHFNFSTWITIVEKPDNMTFSGFSFVLWPSCIVGCLLWLDYRLRKRLRQP